MTPAERGPLLRVFWQAWHWLSQRPLPTCLQHQAAWQTRSGIRCLARHLGME